MTDESGGDSPGLLPLLNAPLEVIKRLGGEPLLLTSVGTAVLLTVIAIVAPGGGRFYALLLAGIVLALGVLRGLLLSTRALREKDHAAGAEADIRLGGDSEIADSRITTRGPSARLRLRSGRRTTIRGSSINTGMDESRGKRRRPSDGR